MSLHKWISKVLPVLLVSGGLAVAQELPDEEQILYIPQVASRGRTDNTNWKRNST